MKYVPKYTFYSFTSGFDIDFVNKITPDTIELFSILLKKFKALNLLSFNLLSINILSIDELRNNCFENNEEKIGILKIFLYFTNLCIKNYVFI